MWVDDRGSLAHSLKDFGNCGIERGVQPHNQQRYGIKLREEFENSSSSHGQSVPRQQGHDWTDVKQCGFAPARHEFETSGFHIAATVRYPCILQSRIFFRSALMARTVNINMATSMNRGASINAAASGGEELTNKVGFSLLVGAEYTRHGSS